MRDCPSRVTLRLRRGLPALRTRCSLRELGASLREACERRGFRVVNYSVQRNHLHLFVESAGKEALGRGMKAISSRVAHAAPRAFGLSGERVKCPQPAGYPQPKCASRRGNPSSVRQLAFGVARSRLRAIRPSRAFSQACQC